MTLSTVNNGDSVATPGEFGILEGPVVPRQCSRAVRLQSRSPFPGFGARLEQGWCTNSIPAIGENRRGGSHKNGSLPTVSYISVKFVLRWRMGYYSNLCASRPVSQKDERIYLQSGSGITIPCSGRTLLCPRRRPLARDRRTRCPSAQLFAPSN
ncbi:hypothetical protein BD626DRAFT_633135 [Schizophyllum amplum]|uniref:Uncharacterized protein n=1 Tax=Schizophyllum amplum TaxID=97359 RepID=A0A550C482_9AGAR|nr:hypothetical protein BD626DRAFT_633135 [Auriculariopsis ampla]